MKVAVLTIFPTLVGPIAEHGMVRVACERRKLAIEVIDIREHATDRYRSVDDYPYGGGPGMVMSPVPLRGALDEARVRVGTDAGIILMSAQGKVLDQELIGSLAARQSLVLICGRYKGVDERFIERHVDSEVSLGNFVLSGGEVAAMTLIEAMARLLPDVLGNDASAHSDSIASGLLEGPLYTRPERFEDLDVPEVLLSGHHARIAAWRRQQALARTYARRPELLERAELTPEEERWLARHARNTPDGEQ